MADKNRLGGNNKSSVFAPGTPEGWTSRSASASTATSSSTTSGRGTPTRPGSAGSVAAANETLKRKLLQYEQTIAEQARRLEEKQNDIEQLRGRLEESRNSRDVTLRDMKESHQVYIAKIQQLSHHFDDAQKQLIEINRHRQQSMAEVRQAHETTLKLEEVRRLNERLTRKIEALESSNAELGSSVSAMKKQVTDLEKSLRASEKEKAHLQSMLRNSMEKRETDQTQQNSVKEKYYEDQIRQLMEENNGLKATVDELRGTNNALSKELSNETKEHGLCKVDIRILRREKKNLEERVESFESNRKKTEDEHEKCAQIIAELQSKIDEAERCTALYKTQSEHHAYQLKYSEQRYEELKAEKNMQVSQIKDLKKEIVNLKNRLELFDNLKSKVSETDSLIQKKQQEIDERDKKITELRTNVGKLKEAATYLDSQLREFDTELLNSRAELKESENKRLKLEGELQTSKENLRHSKVELNEAKSYKLLLLKKVENAESAAQELSQESNNTIQALEKELNAKSSACEELESRVAHLTSELDTVKNEKQMTEYVLATMRGANEGLTGEVQNILDNFVRSKNDVVNLKNELLKGKIALSEAIQKAELYKSLYDKWSEAYNALEKESGNTELQYKTQCDQLNKLVAHLQEENDKLTKKKGFKLFRFGGEKSVPASPMVISTPTPRKGYPTPLKTPVASTPKRVNNTPFTPKENIPPRRIVDTNESASNKIKTPIAKSDAKSTPMKLIKEHQAVKNLEGQAANLKQQLAVLQDKSESGLRKSVTFADNSFDVNCSYLVEQNLFILGCGEGLFSIKSNSSQYRGKVRIEGVGCVHHIEAIDALRLVLMIEGSTRRLVGVQKGMLKVAAQAASCSMPSIDVVQIGDLKDISLISHRTFRGEFSSSQVCLCLATHKHLHLLSWNGEQFVPVKKINVRQNVTCMLISPFTVIFGSDNMWQLDIKNFELEEFMDRTDPTLYYLQFSCETQATYPLSIIDLGKRDDADEDSQEYLLCFSELGVFVDSEGRRSRTEDMVWTKAPKSIVYRAPNLYILHFLSVEIIRINKNSYTRRKVADKGDSISHDQPIIPKSRYLTLENPRLLGFGSKPGSIIVSSSEKAKTEIIEVDLDPLDAM